MLKSLFNFYINSSIHVALAVYALGYITLLEYHIAYTETLLYFLFYGTITGYNFVKYFGIAKFHHRRLANWLRAIQAFSLLSFVLMCYYMIQLPVEILGYILLFGAFTFFYAIPFMPKTLFIDKHHNLRSISGLKVYIIAFVWSGVTVFLPLLHAKVPINIDVLLLGLQRFCFVIALMLPFEIRDLKFDNLRLSTIPQKIGIQQTKTIGIALAILIVCLDFFKNTTTITSMLSLQATIVIYALLLVFARVKQSKYYSSFWVEGIPIVWLLLLIYLL